MQKRNGELSSLSLPAAPEGLSENRGARPVGTGRARAKAIVLGEHAVVYGAPALALPLPQLGVTATAGYSAQSPADPDDFSLTMTGSESRPKPAQASDGLHRLTAEFRAAMGVPDSLHLDVIIDCAIPVGRGLGSSAACARAVVHALADLFEREVTPQLAFDLVQTAENVAHGRASGVDATAVGATAPLLFRAGRAEELPIGCDGLFIVADSGVAGRTKDAVELLREGFRQRPGTQEAFLRRASELTGTARTALAEGRPEQLGAQLTDYHELLRAGGLSTDRIDGMVSAALAAGGLGAKITGGGMGGCVIALASEESAADVTRALLAAGAVQTWSVPLREYPGHGR
ncbi:mevalonate kinase [Kitasatospora purpeofusca]|uniref:mevalonate kinase n=1 Tax=Kitasatospora purpeofusca TaxID=67352 RepID=UPI00225289C3|nr:mevalonate kinase [Kitasatospora purpeofusca]MCX4753767.1 mevalonate kinase [Kitasatospora purpeofusca]